mgnify:FL=1
MLVGSDQDNDLCLWGISEKKAIFLGLEWPFGVEIAALMRN